MDAARQGIFGHSMGGHGALICALQATRSRYRSLSAFAPICAPMRCPWGEKAFAGYLGDDRESWRAYDARQLAARLELAERGPGRPGHRRRFPRGAAQAALLQEAFRAAGIPLTLRYQAGYDHSYYFMASFMADHLAHHARLLNA